jgi:hypothetical protein
MLARGSPFGLEEQVDFIQPARKGSSGTTMRRGIVSLEQGGLLLVTAFFGDFGRGGLSKLEGLAHAVLTCECTCNVLSDLCA